MFVNYDGEDFPGEITCFDGNDQFEVSVMHLEVSVMPQERQPLEEA